MTWRFVLTETVLRFTTQRPIYKTYFHLSSVQTIEASTTMEVKEQIFSSLFRNLSSPISNKKIMAFLRHSDQCLIPSPNIAVCFTNLSRLVLEIFSFFEKHAQNLNTPQNNSASWALQMGFNLAFKGLI